MFTITGMYMCEVTTTRQYWQNFQKSQKIFSNESWWWGRPTRGRTAWCWLQSCMRSWWWGRPTRVSVLLLFLISTHSLVLLSVQEIEFFLVLVPIVQKLWQLLFFQPVHQRLQSLSRVFFSQPLQIRLKLLLCICSDNFFGIYCQLKLSFGCFPEVLLS